MEPFKCGHCLMDFIQGDYEKDIGNYENAVIVYNKNLNHIHV